MSSRARLLFHLAIFGLLGGVACRTVPPPPLSKSAPDQPRQPIHFAVAESELPFGPLADPAVATDRWWGIEEGAGYRIEVPANWNGRLVLYAHGYRGDNPALRPISPGIRRQLVSAGYAWAASTYSANGYDVRAGIEDTNALALAFTRIARSNGRALAEPKRVYIIGQSMGGHIAAAAVEAETLATARHAAHYDGALPICGVVADLELFNYIAAYSLAAQQLAGEANVAFPAANWSKRGPGVKDRFFTPLPAGAPPDAPVTLRDTAPARRLKAIAMNLTGGPRPIFDEGFARSTTGLSAWSFFGLAQINGISSRELLSTEHTVYRFEESAQPLPEEVAFNETIPRVVPAPDANPPQSQGLRAVPLVNGEIAVPVVTLHSIGDLLVPFSMEQVYRRRVDSKNRGQWLVQRAIRSPSHCEFTEAEIFAGFQALVAWVEQGVKAEGDDVLSPAQVADPAYGCRFTNDHVEAAEKEEGAVRAAMPRCPSAHP